MRLRQRQKEGKKQAVFQGIRKRKEIQRQTSQIQKVQMPQKRKEACAKLPSKPRAPQYGGTSVIESVRSVFSVCLVSQPVVITIAYFIPVTCCAYGNVLRIEQTMWCCTSRSALVCFPPYANRWIPHQMFQIGQKIPKSASKVLRRSSIVHPHD
jgi:hypothetical protein